MNPDSIKEFVRWLAGSKVGQNSFNQYDYSLPNNEIRRRNLELYLLEMAERHPKVLLVGEAPSYRGMRMTGIPFTSRATLKSGIQRFNLFDLKTGYMTSADYSHVLTEPTATVMWQTLGELGFLPLLWSAYPFHPHLANEPLSNRAPSASEVTSGRIAWQALAELFFIRNVVAVGNIAYGSIIVSKGSAPKVRHPAHGGKVKFKQGLIELLAEGIND